MKPAAMRDQRLYENATDLVEIVQLSLTQLGDVWGPIGLQRVYFPTDCALLPVSSFTTMTDGGGAGGGGD